MSNEVKRWTAAEALDLIRARHEHAAGWTVLEQVRNASGVVSNERYADALAIQRFPSRGISAQGFEIKVSRSDLLLELRKPEKAAPFVRFCDRWWLVVPDESLVDGVMIPETWGVLTARNRRGWRLHEYKPAPKLTPEPWSPTFVASILRNFADAYVAKSVLEAQQRAEDADLDARAEARAAERIARAEAGVADWKENYRELHDKVRAFEAASGLTIDRGWHAPAQVGEAVRMLLGGRHVMRTHLGNLRDRLASALAEIERVRETVEQLGSQPDHGGRD